MMLNHLLSSMPLSVWRCYATKFASFYDTLPTDELENETFSRLVHFVAPSDGPIVGVDKSVLPFIVPCSLKEAPYTAKTAAKTGRTIGKQRSAAHVTFAWFLVIDVDGVSLSAIESLLNRLRAAGLTFLVYSTHSHGREDKPGVRARLLLPVDRALSADEYKVAWLAFDLVFCDGLIAKADGSGKSMSQQQGVYVAHPDRLNKAFRIVNKGGVASADALIAAAPMKKLPSKSAIGRSLSPGSFGSVERRKVDASLSMLDAGDYEVWIKVCACLVALRECLGGDARRLWLEFSDRTDEARKMRNEQRCYDPEVMFDQITPSMSADVAMSTLMAEAKEAALGIAEAEIHAGTLTESGCEAVKHLACYHRRALDVLTQKYGVTA